MSPQPASSPKPATALSSMDTLAPDARSAHMKKIKPKDTRPELLVRSLLFSLGYRYTLHSHDLPGTPDIVFTARRKVIFVHGCFWHQHHDCALSHIPKNNNAYWKNKFTGNISRDLRNQRALLNAGWSYLIVWECWTRDLETTAKILTDYLGAPSLIRTTSTQTNGELQHV